MINDIASESCYDIRREAYPQRWCQLSWPATATWLNDVLELFLQHNMQMNTILPSWLLNFLRQGQHNELWHDWENHICSCKAGYRPTAQGGDVGTRLIELLNKNDFWLPACGSGRKLVQRAPGQVAQRISTPSPDAWHHER